MATPREAGARSYVTTAVSREAGQEIGGWQVYSRDRPEEVAPEMRAEVG